MRGGRGGRGVRPGEGNVREKRDIPLKYTRIALSYFTASNRGPASLNPLSNGSFTYHIFKYEGEIGWCVDDVVKSDNVCMFQSFQ